LNQLASLRNGPFFQIVLRQFDRVYFDRIPQLAITKPIEHLKTMVSLRGVRIKKVIQQTD